MTSVKEAIASLVLKAMQAKVDSDTYGVSHALKINAARAEKAADDILAIGGAAQRPVDSGVRLAERLRGTTVGYPAEDMAIVMNRVAYSLQELAKVHPSQYGGMGEAVSVADALRGKCGATNGCSCADLNYQWYGPHCEATMTSVFRTLLKEGAAAPQLPANAYAGTDHSLQKAQRTLIGAPGNDQLSKLWNAIVDNTKGDGFWIGEILLTTLEREVGFNPSAVSSTHENTAQAELTAKEPGELTDASGGRDVPQQVGTPAVSSTHQNTGAK